MWEDHSMQSVLRSLRVPERPKVLDLGCGTGFGRIISGAIWPGLSYTGVDLSSHMLGILSAKFPDAKLVQASMSDLSEFESAGFDVVIALYTSLSYSPRPGQTMAEVYRVLKPGGSAALSMINRTSFRRIASLTRGPTEVYGTRGADLRLGGAPAWVISLKEFRRTLLEHGFRNVDVIGHGVTRFAGGWLATPMWERLAARIFPALANTLTATAVRLGES